MSRQFSLSLMLRFPLDGLREFPDYAPHGYEGTE